MAGERRPLSTEEIGRIEALARARTDGTLYDILGLRAGVGQEEIEAAYHQVARQWHPDRFYSRDTGDYASVIEENFVAATRAFRTLRDANKRQAYHRELGLEGRAVVLDRPPERTTEPLFDRPPESLFERPADRSEPERMPIVTAHLNGEVQAGVTSPGGTPVYQTRLPPRPPAAPPPPPKPKPPAAVEKIRQQIAEQLGRAKQYYEAGKADFDAGRYAKAEGALYLAVKFDPKNEDYATLLAQAQARSREGKAKGFISQAAQEESFQRVKEAIAAYRLATDCDPPEGLAYYRLGLLLRKHENDERGAVAWLRKAVQKEPKNVTYRMGLADCYEANGLAANALREAMAALAVDPKHDGAKAMVKRLKR